MKLWQVGVRIFKGINDFKVYHFGSIVTRKYEGDPEIITEWEVGEVKFFFLIKWGISIKFFKEIFSKIDTKYLGELKKPNKNLNYYLNLIVNKMNYFYIKYIYNFKNKHKLIKNEITKN